ncbi:hypothetical protein N7528_009038 [Penicillium herquei]|nr:hypothetical protein N7528_009038 [Penicillium herquei]
MAVRLYTGTPDTPRTQQNGWRLNLLYDVMNGQAVGWWSASQLNFPYHFGALDFVEITWQPIICLEDGQRRCSDPVFDMKEIINSQASVLKGCISFLLALTHIAESRMKNKE